MPLYKILLAILTMMIFGLNAVLTKLGLQDFPPLLLNLLRYLLVLPFLLFVPKPGISWKMLLAIGLCLGIGLLCFTNIGLALGASAGLYVLILQSGSLFAMLFAYLLFGSKPTIYDILGMFLGLIGMFWICSNNSTEGGPLAIVSLICAAASWGLGFTLVKKAHAPSLQTTVWMSVFIIPIMIALTGIFEGPIAIQKSIHNASLIGWGAIAFSSLGSMLGAGCILMYLMRSENIAKVAPFNLLTPLFGCLFSVMILGENLSPSMLQGGALIIIGLILSQFGSKIAQQAKIFLPQRT